MFKGIVLRPDDERRARFTRLTAQEQKHGLLEDPSGIGTRDGWSRRLAERGLVLKGHRLVRANREQSGTPNSPGLEAAVQEAKCRQGNP